MNIKLIAEMAHELNRLYCQSLGDDSQPSWKDAPDWQRDSALNGVGDHLDLLAGGETPAPSQSHEMWLAEKRSEGWVYGHEKDPVKKEHPCMVPFDDLPEEQKMKDYLFSAVVKAFYDCVGA